MLRHDVSGTGMRMYVPNFDFWLVVPFYNLREGIQYCVDSEHDIRTWDEKSSSVRAAVRVDRTAARYGRSTLDCVRGHSHVSSQYTTITHTLVRTIVYCTQHSELPDVLDDGQAVVGVSGDAGGRFVSAARRLTRGCLRVFVDAYRERWRLSQKVEWHGRSSVPCRFVLFVSVPTAKMVVAIAVWCVFRTRALRCC